MSTKFFTNKDGNTLLKKFEGVLEHNLSLSELDILVGFFRSAGFFHLQPHLEGLDQVRILVGINVDKHLSKVEDDKINEAIVGEFCEEITDQEYDKQAEEDVDRFIDNIKSGKIQLRVHPSKQLNAKLYIFRPDNFDTDNSGELITGSSSLSERRNGTNQISNTYDLNVVLQSYEDISFATDEFNLLWEEATEISDKVFEKAMSQTHLVDDITSRDLYYKLLIEYFGEEIEYDPSKLDDLPEEINKLEYQDHAVEQGFRLLEKHNGFFLADVVGLGKTVIATRVARRFFIESNFRPWTLVVCPPPLIHQWKDAVGLFGIENIDYISWSSLHKVEDARKYSLIIVDEAHTFRNGGTGSYGKLQAICKGNTPDGNPRKVILVSATPLNNSPEDLRNLILLFQDKRKSTLGINLDHFFGEMEKEWKTAIKKEKVSKQNGLEVTTAIPMEKREAKIKEINEEIREKVLQHVMVRRTRADLEEFYSDDLQKQGISLPHVNKPVLLFYQLDEILDKLYDETVKLISNKGELEPGKNYGPGLTYTRYQIQDHLKLQFLEEQGYVKQSGKNLEALMKTLLLKRLDSSFKAFHETLKRFVRQTEIMDIMISKGEIYVDLNSKMMDLIESDDMEGLERYLEGKDDKICHKISHFQDDFFEKLDHDKQIFAYLENEWGIILKSGRDPKMEKFIEQLPRMLDTEINPEGKLIVFSESKDTTDYLGDMLSNYRVLPVTSKNRDSLSRENTIAKNFDGGIEQRKQSDEYDILVSTEILAEGVNLQRSNSIVNYDTPWNSTRLMQRVGRVNRIYASKDEIYIYNFLPTAQVDNDIALSERAYLKLLAFHHALGTDSQIYTGDEEIGSFGFFDREIDIDSEPDERLRYLQEVRELRSQNPNEFKRVKQLPLRIRNAVHDVDMSISTFVFLKNRSEDAYRKFYQITNSDSGSIQFRVREITFLRYAKILKNHIDCKTKVLPGWHYEHVRRAWEIYVKKLRDMINNSNSFINLSAQEKKIVSNVEKLSKVGLKEVYVESDKLSLEEFIDDLIVELKSHLSSNEKAAYNLLSSLVDDASLDAIEYAESKIATALTWVELGRSVSLTQKLYEIQQRRKKEGSTADALLNDVIEAIDRFIIGVDWKGQANTAGELSEIYDFVPEIVISQTYVEG